MSYKGREYESSYSNASADPALLVENRRVSSSLSHRSTTKHRETQFKPSWTSGHSSAAISQIQRETILASSFGALPGVPVIEESAAAECLKPPASVNNARLQGPYAGSAVKALTKLPSAVWKAYVGKKTDNEGHFEQQEVFGVQEATKDPGLVQDAGYRTETVVSVTDDDLVHNTPYQLRYAQPTAMPAAAELEMIPEEVERESRHDGYSEYQPRSDPGSHVDEVYYLSPSAIPSIETHNEHEDETYLAHPDIPSSTVVEFPPQINRHAQVIENDHPESTVGIFPGVDVAPNSRVRTGMFRDVYNLPWIANTRVTKDYVPVNAGRAHKCDNPSKQSGRKASSGSSRSDRTDSSWYRPRSEPAPQDCKESRAPTQASPPSHRHHHHHHRSHSKHQRPAQSSSSRPHSARYSQSSGERRSHRSSKSSSPSPARARSPDAHPSPDPHAYVPIAACTPLMCTLPPFILVTASVWPAAPHGNLPMHAAATPVFVVATAPAEASR